MNRHDSLIHLMKHAVKLHRQTVDKQIQPYDVHPGQPPLLLRLSEQDGQSQSELAARIHVTPATLTVMVDRMEKAGIVERRTDPNDQRVSRVYVTDKGRLATEAVKKAILEADEKCFEHFLPEEKLLLRRFLLQIHENLQKPDASN
ncbi:MarR family winged helix-turn-helix transcriptional regulator [Paenibacillus hexagrammi]|uniref:MarR family transcriptional regulator n=1 Tax=Paenibacillus hexagrammi TaxID=2908839 RepID=A0ABY3SIZ4_9BACL|nr:MarR family transcriptional regulator [Paenibacillus sp. YPD9-1]UJF33463.1 MarR family transcriptional regulator [Paenibacillus sp. YPD9-1]